MHDLFDQRGIDEVGRPLAILTDRRNNEALLVEDRHLFKRRIEGEQALQRLDTMRHRRSRQIGHPDRCVQHIPARIEERLRLDGNPVSERLLLGDKPVPVHLLV